MGKKHEKAYNDALAALMEQPKEKLAKAILDANAVAWACPEWDSDMVEFVLSQMMPQNMGIEVARHDEHRWQDIALGGDVYDSDQIAVWRG